MILLRFQMMNQHFDIKKRTYADNKTRMHIKIIELQVFKMY